MRQRLNDFINGLSDRDRKILGVLAIVVILFVFTYFLLIPQIGKYSELGGQITERQAVLDQLQFKAARQKATREKLQKSEEKLEELLALYDKNFENGSALVNLAFNAQNNQVFISSIQPREKIVKEHFIEYPVSLEMRGIYSQILKIMKDIEDSHNLVQIKNMTITKSKIETKEMQQNQQNYLPPAGVDPLLDVAMEISIYAHPKAMGRLEESLAKISEWSTGRDTGAFVFPGFVSPHDDVPAGGDGTLPGVNIKEEQRMLQNSASFLMQKDNSLMFQQFIENMSKQNSKPDLTPQQSSLNLEQILNGFINMQNTVPKASEQDKDANNQKTPESTENKTGTRSDMKQ